LFGVSFLVIAPEHPQLQELTTFEQKIAIETYLTEIQGRSERERQAETKKISGCFTGSYALHPLTGQAIPVWTADYVLAGYGTGAIMAVPAGDERDWNFAQHFNLPIPGIFVNHHPNEGACVDKSAILQESSFLDGLTGQQGITSMIHYLQQHGLGRGITRYRLRDAVFSRQRYWGEPVPIAIENDEIRALPETALPLLLPEIALYLPTAEGAPPLARATDWTYQGKALETTTMPGWAGSSWYFLRYMDPKNEERFADPHAMKYWGPVDLYIGGSEHATGHLLYARFWNHFLYDRGWVPFREPFTRLINQGMIQGISEYAFRSHSEHGLDFWMSRIHKILQDNPNIAPQLEDQPNTKAIGELWSKLQEGLADFSQIFLSEDLIMALKDGDSTIEKFGYRSSVDIRFVDRNHLAINRLLSDPAEGLAFQEALWLGLEGFFLQGKYHSWNNEPKDLSESDFFQTKPEVEKMSKSKRNVVNPDSVIDQYGADTLRLYELFLGPLEDAKPWDTQGIEGVSRFLQKAWRYYRQTPISDTPPNEAALKILHRCIKKISDGMDRMALNTCVSGLMIGLNEIQSASIQNRDILRDYALLLAPFAPHLSEELWCILGFEPSIHHALFPVCNAQYLEEDRFAYPVQQNGKLRFQIDLPSKATSAELTQMALEHPRVIEWLAGRQPTKIIAIPGRILNFVLPN
jgi:leucyl-tRNA synthetase